MKHNEFERTVQTAWDRGRDPVDIPEVRGHLEAHPELLEDFARWRESVVNLQQTERMGARSPYWIAVAAAVLASSLWWVFPVEATSEPRPVVIESSFEHVVERPGNTISWRERRTLIENENTVFAVTRHTRAVR